MGRDLIGDIRDDVTELRIADARHDEKLITLENRTRNQLLAMQALEKRLTKLEGGIAWMLRMAIGIGTAISGVIYAWARKVGLV